MAVRAKEGAAPFVPEKWKLPVLVEAVQKCQGCGLYRHATQAVFGAIDTRDGAAERTVAIMMIGEQPGDQEDKQGRPFVGAAGKLLDKALEDAEIDRGQVYVTNAVKHFKWEPRGKLRIHKKPSMKEIKACRPWLDAEVGTIRPKLIVALGATAAQALLGSSFRITQAHGKVNAAPGLPPMIATLHPAAILRAPTEQDRHRQMRALVEDLRRAAKIAAR